MRAPTILATAVWVALTATAAPAAADAVNLGDTTDVDIVDIDNGVEVEQNWTVSGLKPSNDTIGYPVAGSLWEATATVEIDDGGIPVISGFFARNENDGSYPVLWTVPTPAGVSPAALPPGGSATGKLYFDVTGSAPTAVAVQDADDLVAWQVPAT